MSQFGKILSNLYLVETIKDILGVAVERNWPVYFFNSKTQQRQRLTFDQLFILRKEKNTHVTIEEGQLQRSPLGSARMTLPLTQHVDVIDVFVDDATLPLIQAEFGDGDKKPKKPLAQLLSGASRLHEQPVEPTDEEVEEEYNNNPADRDPRLFEEAVQIKIANPDWKLTKIHNEIYSQEKGKSNVSIDMLKHIVKLNKLNQAVKRRIAMEEKRKVSE